MSSTSNVFTNEPDFTLPDGVSIVQVAKRAGAELLGGTVYAMEPGSRWADLHVHHANEEMIVVLDGAPTLHTLDGHENCTSATSWHASAGGAAPIA